MGAAQSAFAFDQALAAQAVKTLERAADYFTKNLAVNGTYVWSYSDDLTVRKGEGDAGPTIGWVQPPGTPAVGAALLRIYEVTGDPRWLKDAEATGRALVATQLLSGGWYYSVDTARIEPPGWCYRVQLVTSEICETLKGNKHKNRTLLDDATTQSALLFLVWLESKLQERDGPIVEAIMYGLEKLMEAQYANGAWPNVIERKHRGPKPVAGLKASLPQQWSREWVEPEGGPYFILNDNAHSDTIRLFLVAAERYKDEDLAEAASRAGDFLIDAQLPEPQRGWAQTYDVRMHPVWGRKFEPPAAASVETAGVIASLVKLYRHTRDVRFLTAAREGADWLRSVRLPDGDWARFYELGTNRPLYVNEKEELTYEPVDLLRGYGFRSRTPILEALADVDAAEQEEQASGLWPSIADHMSEADLEARIRSLLQEADEQARWVKDGWIESATFVDAAFMIAKYVNR
jgi:hypothetical protein